MKDIYTLGETLLQLVVDQFAELGFGLPDVKYVAPGASVAFDTDQITVNATSIDLGTPGATDGLDLPHTESFYVTFLVCIVRNTPMGDLDGGSPPSVDDLQASAQDNMNDLGGLTQALTNIRNAPMPNGLVDAAFMMSFTTATPIGPEGGVVAVGSSVMVSLL